MQVPGFFDGFGSPTPTGTLVREDGTVVVVSGRLNKSTLEFTPLATRPSANG